MSQTVRSQEGENKVPTKQEVKINTKAVFQPTPRSICDIKNNVNKSQHPCDFEDSGALKRSSFRNGKYIIPGFLAPPIHRVIYSWKRLQVYIP